MRWLRKYGYNDSHSGNASVRDGNTIWMTPTGACADILHADDLIACSLQMGVVAKMPHLMQNCTLKFISKTQMHVPVFHSHGPHTIAFTMNGEDFIPEDFEGKLYFPNRSCSHHCI